MCSGGFVTRDLVILHPATLSWTSKAAEQKEEVYLKASRLLARRGLGKLLAKTVSQRGTCWRSNCNLA
jgi:hypothetical protein